jgi:hypothetical protein
MKGLDLPKVRSGDAQRPLYQGEFAGIDVLAGRDIMVTLFDQEINSTEMGDDLSALQYWLQPPLDGVTEMPMWFYRPTQFETLACLVRVRQYGLQGGNDFAYSHIAKPIISLHATGALLYGPTAETEASSGSDATCVNNGSMPCAPYIILYGPGTGLTVTNTTAPGAPYMGFSNALGDDDYIILDMDADSPTALLYTSGVLTGSALQYLVAGSQPFTILPGSNTISYSGAAAADIQWADAFASGA